MSFEHIQMQKPSIEALSKLETGVLMTKFSLLLGMINYGTPEQKAAASAVVDQIEGFIHNHVNFEAFEQAKANLGFSDKELEFLEKV